MKRTKLAFLTIILIFLYSQPVLANTTPSPCKNVIMMIMDGTNSSAVTLSRWYKGSSLALDEMVVGGVRTYSLRSVITDSASAATAMATGHKTIVDKVGMAPLYPSDEANKPKDIIPKASILEAAKSSGYATGLVATAPIQHATPAGFSAHVLDREMFSDIAEQQVYQGIDVVLGGGKASLLPGDREESRNDGENLLQVLKEKDYTLVNSKHQLASASGRKIWGSFAEGAMAYDIDRKAFGLKQPSLAEMTEKAIHTLSQQKKGFFLMVEGSKVDWAAHLNDPVGIITEVLAFDEAVKKALDFANADGKTLVIAVADHGNSGLSIGDWGTDTDYAISPPAKFIRPIKQAKLSVEGAVSLLKKDHSNLVEVASYYGLKDLQREELDLLQAAKHKDDVKGLLAQFLAKRAHIGFTTHGHTGEDVLLYSFGPGKPAGLLDNIDLAKVMADYLEVNLDETTDALFVDAEQWFKGKGYKTRIEPESKNNEVFVARKDNKEIRYPKNKNFRVVNGKVEALPGVNVFNGKRFFVARPGKD
ncbi:alkaline phosphatase [Bacillus oleivorans]|uniref:Alkaline phosphatase n=1 Tax=Bacillus oleivorans TaxID=1448271 RepID=A0A285CIB5_9BACI|nr:alkaline phosphatase [Bacillus oleivorans]SNX67334.1 alkaline phosphatase [Bacillus oleivorans]